MDIERMAAISRRNLLVGAVAGGLTLTAAEPAGAIGASALEDPLQAYRKLRYRTDAGLVFWWLRGIKYGQVGTTLTALYTNHVGTVMRIQPRSDGGQDVTSLEVTLQSSVDDDTALREWTNPYTGETLPLSVRPVGPTTVSYDQDGARDFPTELGGARLEVEAESHAPTVVGDRVFLSEHIRARVFRPERETPFVVNDISQYQGSLSEVLDPAITGAGATVSFGEVTGWQRWMKMGDLAGNLTSRTVGAKVASYAEMPQAWRQAVEDLAPALAEQLSRDPSGALDQKAAEFDR